MLHEYEEYSKDTEGETNAHYSVKEYKVYHGHYNSIGAHRYLERGKEKGVHKDNYNVIKGVRENLPISKMIMGTQGNGNTKKEDLNQYVAMKWALMTGGVNHIDTSNLFRENRSELVVGAVLRTLIERYGFAREEFFINSKFGCISNDSYDRIPHELQVEELIATGKVEYEDFFNGRYSLHPNFLDHSLTQTL